MVLSAVGNSSMSSSSSGTHSMSTDSSAHTEQQSSVYTHPLYRVSHYIWLVWPPIILLVGNFGNVMTIIIMHRQKSGEAIINVYFTALAVVDLITLDVLLLGNWVGITFGYFINAQHVILCKLHSWMIQCTTTGGWFLVSLTAHRAASVVWPHRVNALCTRRLVVRALGGITVFFALVYCHYLYGHSVSFRDSSGYRCTMVTGSYAMFVQNVFSYVQLVLNSILPFICIVLANVVLVWKLRATIREVRVKFAGRESAAVDREKAASSVTLTIITVSLTFVVLTLPASVYYISLYVYDPSAVISVADQARTHVIKAVTYMLMFSNCAVNFYLYCLTGAKFRKEFVQIFCPRGL